MENHDLAGARVLVSGGTTGIGRATAHLLAKNGARVLIFGRHEKELGEALADAPGEIDVLTADAATREGIADVFAAVDDRLGGLDVLVACAGIGGGRIDELPDEEWRYVVETNLMGYMACARGAAERMTSDGGRVVFIGSVSSNLRPAGSSVYSATKAGGEAFADAFRKEVAEQRIIVTEIQPGAVDTDMQDAPAQERREKIDEHLMLTADDVAEVVLFVLQRPMRADIVRLQIEPRRQPEQRG